MTFVSRIRQAIEEHRCTLLGVGPMSMNCVDATIDLSKECIAPTLLIASRRQIDSEEFGGGYVNNWNTAEFSSYVRRKVSERDVILCRDHGGPWQNNVEIESGLPLYDAMQSAKRSFLSDIESGIQIIHIDPSIEPDKLVSTEQSLDRIFELYEFCWIEAQRLNKTIAFEIGTEEQSGTTNTQEELKYTLEKISEFTQKNHLPQPTFVVIQSGTKVMETRNIGTFDSPIRIGGTIPSQIQVPKMIELCKQFHVYMKEHNADYLSDEALEWHPRLGIHAANVAPAFGVSETKALVKLLRQRNLISYEEEFLQIAFDSGKWAKWMLPNTNCSDREKAVIAGHYCFSSPEFIDLKTKIAKRLNDQIFNVDDYLKSEIKIEIKRYMKYFRLLKESSR